MGSLGSEYPKALLPVGDRPVIQHQLDLLARLGVRDVYIVVGYRARDVMDALGTAASGMRLHYVDQGPPLGSAHALGRLRSYVDHPLLVLLGDYHLVSDGADRMAAYLHGDGSAAIAAKQETDRALISQACALEVDATGRVLRIVEKPVAPDGDLKGCGFYALPPTIFDAVARTPRTALRDEYELSVALELHIERGYPLFAETVVDWDTNLTEPADMLRCNLAWLRRSGRNQWIGPHASVHPTAQLERAVIGAGARVDSGARLEDVVVLPRAQIGNGQTLRRRVVTPTSLISCP